MEWQVALFFNTIPGMDMTGKEVAFPMLDRSRVNELLSGIKVNNFLLDVPERKDFYREPACLTAEL